MFQLIIPIFFLFFIQKVEGCGQIINDLGKFDFDLELEPNCDNYLPIYRGKSIQLNIPCESFLSIWLIVNVDNKDLEIFHSNFTFTCDRRTSRNDIWQAPKDTGLRVKSEEKLSISVHALEKSNVCGYPYIELKENVTVIQEDVVFDNSQECVYRLVPKTDKDYNGINIEFDEDDQLDYEQRIYTSKDDFQIGFYKNNFTFLMENFDLKTKLYVEPPKIVATLKNNPCIQQIKKEIKSGNETIIVKSEVVADDCENPLTAFEITFSDMKENEVVYFQNEFKIEEISFNISELSNRSKIIMDKDHWTRKASLKTNGLYIKISSDSSSSIEMNFTRVTIENDCKCSNFGTKVSTKNDHFVQDFPSHCVNVFCHLRLENPEGKMLDVRSSFFTGHVTTTHGGFYAEHEAFTMLSVAHPWVEIASIRFNASSFLNELTVNNVWRYTLNCECSADEIFVELDTEETLESINFPEKYCANLDCKTNIRTQPNASLQITIERMTVGEGDFLEIYNGNTTDATGLIKSLTGRYINQKYETGSQAVLFFQTDNLKSDYDIGYRIIVKSRIAGLTTTEATTTEMVTTEMITTTEAEEISTTSKTLEPTTSSSKSMSQPEESSSSHGFLIFFIIVVILVAGAGYVYREKIVNRPLQFNNIVDGARGFMNMNAQVF